MKVVNSMLILTRKKGQSIIINNNIEILISSIEGDQIKVGIVAPNEVTVLRKEIYEAIQKSNKEALGAKAKLAHIKALTKPKEN